MQLQSENTDIAATRTPVISFMAKFMESIMGQENIELIPYSKWQKERLVKVSASNKENRPAA